MIDILVIAAVMFTLGCLAGIYLTWWYMERQWKRNPYHFRTIVEGVIALREERAQKK